MNIEDFEIEGTVLKKYKGSKWGMNVIIPSGITEIGENAFEKFENLKSVEFPNTLIKIGARAFEDCKHLESVNLPESITEIGDFAFCRCYKLKNINLPKNITQIGKGAFEDCVELEYINIPHNIREIKDSTFYGCSSLKYVPIDDAVSVIGKNAFNYCRALSIIRLPQSLTILEENAFCGCENLVNINIPYGVKKICKGAFEKCGFKNIDIPDTVQEIDDAFNLGNIETIFIRGQHTKISGNFFKYSGSVQNNVFWYYWHAHICIKCPLNSYAYQYAIENNIPCEPYSDIMQVEPVVWQTRLLINNDDGKNNSLGLTIGNYVKLAVIDDKLSVLTLDDKLITYMSNEKSREISLKIKNNYTYLSTIGNVLKDNQDKIYGIVLKIEEYPPMPECNQEDSLNDELYNEVDHMEALNSYMSDFPDDDAYENWSESNDF